MRRLTSGRGIVEVWLDESPSMMKPLTSEILAFLRGGANAMRAFAQNKFISRVLTGLWIVASTWILMEVALVVLDPVIFKGLYEYEPELGFRVRPYANGSNEFGFNDRDRPHRRSPGTYRILMLGDSFNWPGGRDCSYSAMLEQKFRTSPELRDRTIEVINVGYPMTGTPEEFLALRKYGMQYEPNMVVLGFFAGNDFGDSRPYRKRIVVNTIYFDIDRRQERRFLWYPVIAESRILHLIRHRRTIREMIHPVENDSIEGEPNCHFLKGPTFTEDGYQKVLDGKFRFLSYGADEDDHYRPSIQNVAGTIRVMREYLRSQNVDLKVAILPDEVQVNPDILKYYLAKSPYSQRKIELLRPQRMIREILEREGISYLDLFPGFEAAARGQNLYVLRDTHWNRAGNELAAQLLYDWLLPALARVPAN